MRRRHSFASLVNESKTRARVPAVSFSLLRLGRVLFPASTIALALLACGGDDTPDTPPTSVDAGPRQPPQRPAASCPVVIEAPAFLGSNHVPEGTAITYNSNPPSSGNHFAKWLAFKDYDKPVERRNMVHNLEHGAIVLLYNCALAKPGAPCPQLIDQLKAIKNALPDDPLCQRDVRVRTIIAPDPELDVPVAAAAWGFTYKADCVDTPTLEAFAKEHYAKGPENVCVQGEVF